MSTFASLINNGQTFLGAAYTAGSGTMTLGTGYGAVIASRLTAAGFPAVSSSAPLRFTAIAAAALNEFGQIVQLGLVTIFEATGLAGDVLSGVAAVEGTTDQNFAQGDVIAVLLTAGQIQAIQAAIAALQAGGAGMQIGGSITGGASTGDILVVGAGPVLAQQATVAVNQGGTGQATAAAGFNALSPLTTLGDTLYGGTSGAGTRLAGNTTASKEFLTQTGTGSVSAAPAWAAIVAADVPKTLDHTWITDFVAEVETVRLDQMAAPTSAVSFNGQNATNLANPVNPQDAATKAYTDAAIQGLQIKPTATVATTGALPANTYANGASGVGATITFSATGTVTVDTHQLAAADLVLVQNEGTASHNGLYTVTTAPAVGVAGVLTRHVDMQVAAEFPGAIVPVGNAGSVNANSLWLANPGAPVTVGTTAIPFTQLNGATDLIQGTAISISGNTISVSTVPIGNGGTGQITASAGFNALSPMTTLGDTLYGGTSGAGTRLAGSTSATKQFLTQTGTGSVSAAPAWGTLANGDLPTSGATAGTYTLATVTVNAQGIVTSASSGSVAGPAGSTGQVQWNGGSGTFAAGSWFAVNTTDDNVTIGNALIGGWHVAAGYLVLGNANLNQTVNGNAAVLQSNVGQTIVGSASGNTFNVRVGTIDYAIFNNNSAIATLLITNSASANITIRGMASQTAPLLAMQGLSSTSTARDVGYVDAGFISSTDASYTGFVRLCAQDFNATTGGREGVRVASTGTLPVVTITGTTTFADGTDTTKKIALSAAGNTTGVTLTLAVGQTTSQTLTIPNIREAETLAIARAPTLTSVASPGTNATTTVKMAGLAAAITPEVTGRVFVLVTGIVANNTIGDGVNVQLAWGTGGAPANGAAATGTTVGLVKHFIASTAAGQQGIALGAFISGLTNGTAIWVDLQFAAVTGGTATLKDCDVVLEEL